MNKLTEQQNAEAKLRTKSTQSRVNLNLDKLDWKIWDKIQQRNNLFVA